MPVFHILATSKLGKAGIMVQWYSAGLVTERSRVSRQLNSGRSGGRIFFPRVNFLCDLFLYPFHPRVTVVAGKRSQSFCKIAGGRLEVNI